MTAPDPAWVKAGARASALWHRGETVTDSDEYALAIEVVRAVEPLIREQIAQQIDREAYTHSLVVGESPSDQPEQVGRDHGIALGLRTAARIARGTEV